MIYRIVNLGLVLFIAGCGSRQGDTSKVRAAGESSPVVFTDITRAAGITFVNDQGDSVKTILQVMGSGAAWGDYDNDGDLDLYLVNGAGSQRGNCLYRNNGDGTFTDVTGQAGVGYKGQGMGAVFADSDNDGDLDLYLTNNGPNILYRNNGDGTFTDITREAGVGDPRWSAGAAFADSDNDGDLDLYVANYLEFGENLIPQEAKMAYDRDEPLPFLPHPYLPQRNTLYLNNGDGTFSDITDRAGVADLEGKSLGVVFGDYDNDGDQDLYIANDVSNDVLFRNNRDGTFTNINVNAGVDDPRGGMGVCFGDYDNDGDLDLFVTNWQDEMNVLYRNNLPKTPVGPDYVGNFDDVTVQAGLGETSLGFVGWGTDFFDYDNDGDLDLFVANGYTSPGKDKWTCIGERNLLFRNNTVERMVDHAAPHPEGSRHPAPGGATGGAIFTDVSASAGEAFKRELVGRGAAFGDYDNDGDVDVVVVNNNGPVVLLRNDGGSRKHWLKVRLTGTKSNRFGIGARITTVSGERRQIREVTAGSSYLSCNSVEAEFGFGVAVTVDSLIVRWPSGIVQTITGVGVNRVVTVVEKKREERKEKEVQ